MAKAGVQFGHKPSKLFPKMEEFIFRIRGKVYLLDLEKTKEKLEEAIDHVRELNKKGGTTLFVGTKIQHKDLIRDIAEKNGQPFVTERWLGGLLTNFKVMRDRVAYLKELREKMDSDDFEKYSKKEQSEMKQELKKLEMKFGGVEEMSSLPDLVFVCDFKGDNLALRESKKKGVDVMGLVDTNIDPTDVDYPIPANDDSISSVKYILNKIDEYGFDRKS